MPNDIKWHELCCATEESLDRFTNDPKRFCHNFIVWIRRRYEYDPMWEYSRELLLFEGFSSDGKPQYAWLRDWYEGHDEVEYLAVADLDEDDAEPTKEESEPVIPPKEGRNENFTDSGFGHWKRGAKVEISKPGGVIGFREGLVCADCGEFVPEDDPPAKCPECGRKMLKPGITIRGDMDVKTGENL